VGIYLGGSDGACAQPHLTPGWLAQEAAAGLHALGYSSGVYSSSSSGVADLARHFADGRYVMPDVKARTHRGENIRCQSIMLATLRGRWPAARRPGG
jgi:hypothetical protein